MNFGHDIPDLIQVLSDAYWEHMRQSLAAQYPGAEVADSHVEPFVQAIAPFTAWARSYLDKNRVTRTTPGYDSNIGITLANGIACTVCPPLVRGSMASTSAAIPMTRPDVQDAEREMEAVRARQGKQKNAVGRDYTQVKPAQDMTQTRPGRNYITDPHG